MKITPAKSRYALLEKYAAPWLLPEVFAKMKNVVPVKYDSETSRAYVSWVPSRDWHESTVCLELWEDQIRKADVHDPQPFGRMLFQSQMMTVPQRDVAPSLQPSNPERTEQGWIGRMIYRNTRRPEISTQGILSQAAQRGRFDWNAGAI